MKTKKQAHPLSAKFLKKYKKHILDTSKENAYFQGYVLHGYFPPKTLEALFEEYIKAGRFAVISIGENSFPSIWSDKVLARDKVLGPIHKKYEQQSEIEERGVIRKLVAEQEKKAKTKR